MFEEKKGKKKTLYVKTNKQQARFSFFKDFSSLRLLLFYG